MFSEEIMNKLQELKKIYRRKKTFVAVNYPIVEITKYISDKEVSLKLFYFSEKNSFEMQPPDHRFYSRISHYDYKKIERRWTRDKSLLFPFIMDLKESGLWEYVSNKDIIIVNSFNKNTNTEKLWNALKDLNEPL